MKKLKPKKSPEKQNKEHDQDAENNYHQGVPINPKKTATTKESPSKSPTRSAESGSRIIFSETGSKNMQFFRPDDEVDRPHTKLDIHVEESSSSSDKGGHHNETEIPPPPPKAGNSDVNSKLDSLLTMVSAINSS